MIKNIPKRRFKGFNDEWEEKKLGEIYDFYKGKGLSLKSFRTDSQNKAIAYGHLYTIYDEIIINVEKYSDEEGILSLKGDILFPGSSTVPLGTAQANALMLDNIHLGGDIIIARDRNNINFSPFMSYLINFHKNKMFPITTGTTITHMYSKDLEILTYILPSLPEQQKIGAFFQKLDKQISLYDQKVNKLNNLKKSYLNRMFPKDNMLYPELRFKGFNDEWEEKKLEEIANIIGGGTPSTKIYQYWDGDIDWYTPTELTGKIYLDGSEKKISKLGLERSSAKLLPANKTILFTSRASIGKTAILKRSSATNQGFQSIVVNENISLYFLYSMSGIIKKQAEKLASGSTFAEISGKELGNICFIIPCEKEQLKIGSFFSKLDTLINLYRHKYNKLTDLKKAYLNEMFVNK